LLDCHDGDWFSHLLRYGQAAQVERTPTLTSPEREGARTEGLQLG